jgi:GTP-binding protein
VEVPPGTQVTDSATGTLLADLVHPGDEIVVAAGGSGGRGNARFATSTQRAPRRAEEGRPGERRELVLTLKLLADVGLVGLPNAGKSTLLARLSAARPKIADYPFTTVEPHLGVVHAPSDELTTCVMADIPGLIEGAHTGAGLGAQFLQHVERCRLLLHLVDLVDSATVSSRAATVARELEAWGTGDLLTTRPVLLVGTKLDALSHSERSAALEGLARSQQDYGAAGAFAVSAVTGDGLDTLLGAIFEALGREA